MSARGLILAPALLALALLALPAAAVAQIDLGTEEQRQAGKVTYDRLCSQCHGDIGDGLGAAAPYLKPAPRDFTSGKYKIRTTPTGSMPLDSDLERVIREGLPYTAMPGFPRLSEGELTDLIYYLKSFADDFEDPEAYLDPFPMPAPPPYDAEQAAEAGRQVYEETGCARCHGELGRGDGPSAPTLVDDWGVHIRPADLSKPWTFRGGSSREAIFRSMSSGFNGTPMPGFYGALTEEQIWHIVDYMIYLADGRQEAEYDTLVTAVGTTEELDLSRGEELFADAPQAIFPVVGQIMEPGRNFYPAATSVDVRAVYNREEIAFIVQWHDMAAETAGTNGPELIAPVYVDEIPEYLGETFAARLAGLTGGGGDEEDEGSIWGDAEVEEDEGSIWGDAEATEEEDDGGSFWGDDEATEEEDDGGSFWGDDEATEEEDDGGSFWGDEEDSGEDEGDFWGEGEDEETAVVTGPRNEFSDAIALQFPMNAPQGVRKPYFLMGDVQEPVHLWFADMAQPETGRLFEARGTGAVTESDGREPEIVSSYEDGRWTVIFKRSRRAGGVPFTEGTFVPLAASVWDGFNRERGNRRGVTAWQFLYLEPLEEPSPLGPMAKAGLSVLGLELLIIGLVRRRRNKQSEANLQPQES